MGIGDGAVVENVIIGGGDGATFFQVFDFAEVAFADGSGVEGTFGAFGDAGVAGGLVGDDGDEGELAGEFVFEDFVFGPGVDAVENDAFLAGGDEVFDFGDGLTDDPVGTFGLANHFAEVFFAFAVGGAFDAAFLHFFVNHTAKVDFGNAVIGEVVDGDGLTAAAHTDEGEDFDVFVVIHIEISLAREGRKVNITWGCMIYLEYEATSDY